MIRATIKLDGLDYQGLTTSGDPLFGYGHPLIIGGAVAIDRHMIRILARLSDGSLIGKELTIRIMDTQGRMEVGQ